MGEMITLKASDGFAVPAYKAMPEGTPRGAIVVIQEIFGVNAHIKRDADKFAKHGYVAIAPQLFERWAPGLDSGYTMPEIEKCRAIMPSVKWEEVTKDLEAAVAEARKYGKVGDVGYCWGGTAAWVAATKLGVPSVGYYGGGVTSMPKVDPKAPVELHFGAQDKMIPLDGVAKFQAEHPAVPIFIYDADHGFNCDERPSFNKKASEIALQRTLAFFAQHVG
ncbi:MAG: dienelactone hydrolase family protein [Rhodospirillaceae bacterium]|nr:dienelactone hydrolase family protein [Rhodospirillaceae bacterium]